MFVRSTIARDVLEDTFGVMQRHCDKELTSSYGYLGKHMHSEEKYDMSPSAITFNLLRKREQANANGRSGGNMRRRVWDLRARKNLNVVDVNPSHNIASARFEG